MTFSKYFDIWIDELVECETDGAKPKPTYSDFIQSWYAYMNLLDLDFAAGMVCEECGPSPRTVICDGTSLGFQKKFLSVVLEACPVEKKIIRRLR